jgi:hypothetical protein
MRSFAQKWLRIDMVWDMFINSEPFFLIYHLAIQLVFYFLCVPFLCRFQEKKKKREEEYSGNIV